MPEPVSPEAAPAILIVGASRGIGLAMAAEFLDRGWSVVGSVRGAARTELHDLADRHPGRAWIEALDIDAQEQIAALRNRLSGHRFQMLLMNAGTVNADPRETIGQVSTDEFVRVMVTNALSPMRVVEALHDLVTPEGVIAVMSSGQGSIGNNERGGNDVYRASKAALNQLMRCFAARQAQGRRALVLMAPGWIRTALGGPSAPFGLEESAPKVADVLMTQQGKPGLQYLDREGRSVPW